jgi:hypothetical protein
MVSRFYLQFEILSVRQIKLISIHFMDNFTSISSCGFYKSVGGNMTFRFELVTAFILAR